MSGLIHACLPNYLTSLLLIGPILIGHLDWIESNYRHVNCKRQCQLLCCVAQRMVYSFLIIIINTSRCLAACLTLLRRSYS